MKDRDNRQAIQSFFKNSNRVKFLKIYFRSEKLLKKMIIYLSKFEFTETRTIKSKR